MRISILGGRIIDPGNGIDAILDLHLGEDRIVAVGPAPDGFTADRTLQVPGHVVCPGLVDLRARLREPGHEHKATIASETRAAAAAGITTLCCPPDTVPVIDTPAVVEMLHRRAADSGHAKIEVLGAMTQGLEGKQLAEMGALGAAGCVGISNGLQPISDTEFMLHAMEYAATFNLTVFLHAADYWLARDRSAHEGAVATRLGLPGLPETAETIAVARDLLLVEQTGVSAHFCHLTTDRAVEMVAQAQARGLPVTADVTAHHLHLIDLDIANFHTQCRVCPPLRTQRDRDGLRRGITTGVISTISSDHQPHELDAKLAPFSASEPGTSALETLLPLTLHLEDDGILDLNTALASITSNPACILGLEAGTLGVGKPADICIFDPQRYWTLTEENIVSRGHNSPFIGWELRGRVSHTLLGG
ncbi:MAG: dihydroorotase, partial [Rhodobacteraceae bacterium]|nr:dihydroorotase [Paracoccaceae bacterium]